MRGSLAQSSSAQLSSTFHNRSVRSPLPDTIRLPSGLNATLETGPLCPLSGSPIGFPVAASHTRSVLSALPDDDALAVGAERHALNLTAVTLERLADRLSASRRPTPAPCCPNAPATMRLPSGLNATLATDPLCPLSGSPIGLPVSASHTRSRVVPTPDDDALAVGAERHALNTDRCDP